MATGTSRIPWERDDRPLLLAEVGGNHEGDFEAACRLCDLAIGSGADYVKFQIYSADGLVNPRESPERHRHFRRFELSPDQHLAVAERCRSAGVGYCASVWEPGALEWIDSRLDFYKIGSGDLTNWPLIAEFAERGKPILLSTGLATLEEILQTITFIRRTNPAYEAPGRIALLQCTTMYPSGDGEANLRAIDTLRAATGLAVGYSDHTEGSLALLGAAARGARILEFHFTDRRAGRSFRDHAVSLEPDEVRVLEGQLRRLTTMLGDGVKRPTTGEMDAGHVESFRRALYCSRPLKAGEAICCQELVALRPNHGVDARHFRDLEGRVVARDTEPFEPIMVE